MYYLEAPNYLNVPDMERPLIFLAGGIRGCPDWQAEFWAKLDSTGLPELDSTGLPGTVLNPRRKGFPKDENEAEVRKQIEWEFRWLWEADIIPFWFCKETLCPIVLFELGSHLSRVKLSRHTDLEISNQFVQLSVAPRHVPTVIVGIEPGYQRAIDVDIQVDLAAPTQIQVVNSLDNLISRTRSVLNRMEAE